MTVASRPIGAPASPKPALVVCLDSENRPLPRITPENADLLSGRGWARWIGTGTRRHLQLTDSAPLALLASYRSSGGTRRDRADYTCHRYEPGQPFGSNRILEHKPI